ncbi:MAG: YcaQ family DNA glycosylase [Alphaproteobacteria bacterium]|nr:YcaQ family DNA glycosylase [Alphaproteobacteria bacterium]
MKSSITPCEARRIALHAQGFQNQSRDKRVTWGQMAAALRDLHLLQIDSVNVLVRSHYLPLFSRLGDYDRAALDKRTLEASNRQVFECWSHEASLVPLDLHPLMRWRMNRARAGNGIYKSMDRFAKDEKAFLKKTLEHIRKTGPLGASAIPGSGKGEGGWWGWSKGKMTMETLFDHGLVTTARRDKFERIYDVPERVIPAEVLNLPTPNEPETFQHLIIRSAQALGIATEFDLRDYFRLPIAETKTAIAECVENGELLPINVDGWSKPYYIHAATKLPRKAGGTALLSPFDPLCWERDRTERIFNFHYRIEIYTPAEKRKFGYYVLPFLNGEDLCGRVCLKADREAGILRANALYHEDMVDPEETAEAMAAELKRMAGWLGLANIEIKKSGNLAAAVAKHF